MEGGWLAPRLFLFIAGNDPILIVKEAVWAQGPVWTGVENLAPIGILSVDRPDNLNRVG